MTAKNNDNKQTVLTTAIATTMKTIVVTPQAKTMAKTVLITTIAATMKTIVVTPLATATITTA